ncbi:MAG: ATP-binding cassette, subfamily bacterial [Actinomycetota bacterium]|jgi:ATP-binding cassette subfamily B protein
MTTRGVVPKKPGLRATWRSITTAMRIGFKATPSRMLGLSVMRGMTEFSGPIQAWGVKVLTDGFFAHDHAGAIRGALLVAGALVIGDALSWTQISFLMSVRERVGQAMDRELIGLAMDVPGIEHYERPEYQDELQLLRQQRGQLANIPDSTIGTAGLVLRSVTTMGLLAAIHPALLFLPVFGIPAVVVGGVVERRARRAEESVIERMRSYYWLYATATEREHGKELRVFSTRDGMLRRHNDLSAEVTGEITTVNNGSELLTGLAWLMFTLGFVAVTAFVAVRVKNGDATPGDLALALSLSQQINNQLTGAANTVGFMMRCARVGYRYVWLSDYAKAAKAAVIPVTPAALPGALRDGIVFEHVSFRYPGTDVDVLHDVNLRLRAGSTVALVGDNGAGKSTLIKLLCRFYEPTEGRILVDGVPLSDVDPAEWRLRMAAGFQDFARFELLAQTAVGVGDLPLVDDSAAVHGALDRASALDVVADLPSGLDTQLGRSFATGVELSGGQWQKLALGRAMMREHPLLLVLDEPTSSLDPQTEHALFERYAGAARRVGTEVGAITVLVSHRFSTVRMADHIVLVGDGVIAEEGTHAELVGLGGTYAELYELQARAYR